MNKIDVTLSVVPALPREGETDELREARTLLGVLEADAIGIIRAVRNPAGEMVGTVGMIYSAHDVTLDQISSITSGAMFDMFVMSLKLAGLQPSIAFTLADGTEKKIL